MNISASLQKTNPFLAKYAQSINKILDANSLCTLATVDSKGNPHANTAYFAVDSYLNIYLLTQPSTQHGKNIERNHQVAITIFESNQPWGKPHRGLQLGGICKKVGQKEQGAVFHIYSTKHPELLNLVKTSSDMAKELESRFYGIKVTWLKLIDEAKYGMETHFFIKIKRN